MAPIVPFIPLITGVLGAAATVTTAVISNNQAKDAAKRQVKYQEQLTAQEAATEAEEKRITQESLQRQQAYGASLLEGNTGLNNVLSGGYNEENYLGGSLLGNTLGSSSVSSVFA